MTVVVYPKITGTRVEEPEYDAGDSGTAKTIDLARGPKQKLRLTGNCTVTLSNFVNGSVMLLRLVQNGSGGNTCGFDVTELTPAAGGFTVSSGANEQDLLNIY